MVSSTSAPPERLYRPDISLDRMAASRRGGQPVRPLPRHPNRRARSRMSLAAPPMPTGRMIAAGAHEYHVIDARRRRSQRSSSTAADPAAPAWSDFGPVAPLFAAEPSLRARRPAPVREVVQADHHAVRCGTTTPIRSWSCSTRSHIERADLVCNSWGGTIALDLAARYPERARSLVVTGSMPVLYGAFGATARGRAPGAERARPLLRGRRSLLGEDAPAHRPPRVVRRGSHPGRDGDDALRAEPRSRGDGAGRGARTSRVANGTTSALCSSRSDARCCSAGAMYDGFLTPDYPLMLARMVPRGHLYVMDHASHHLQEERPLDYYRVVTAFLDMDHDSLRRKLLSPSAPSPPSRSPSASKCCTY